MSWRSRRSVPPPQPFPLDYAAHLPRYKELSRNNFPAILHCWTSQQWHPITKSVGYFLTSTNADIIKQMARVWAKDSSKLSKDACAKAIVGGLATPSTVQAVVNSLSPFERAGLGLLKRHGQIAPTEEFAIELFMLGLPLPVPDRRYAYGYHRDNDPLYGALNSLLRKGLVLAREWDQIYGYAREAQMDQYHYRPEVFSDQRLLARVEVTPPVELSLKPVANAGESGISLQPAEVVLRFVSMVETLRKLGRIDITSKGRLAKPFLTKLTKALGWESALENAADTPLPQATLFFFKLIQSAGFLQSRPDLNGLEVNPQANTLFEASYNTQATAWINGYRSLKQWAEYTPQGMYFEDDEPSSHTKFPTIRAALLMALAALPNASAWYRLSDLSEAIYERIGDNFSLLYFYGFSPAYGTKPEEEAKHRAEWQKKNHSRWRVTEQEWITHAMTGPLYHLGLVTLARAASGKTDEPALFRLTSLGRSVWYDASRTPGETSTEALLTVAPDGPCWVVQPNFDVVVYLDRASAPRLAFIERIAARKPSTGATALYHLTRETVPRWNQESRQTRWLIP